VAPVIPLPPQPPLWRDDSDPVVVITRPGRWVYHIDIQHGITGMNHPWLAFSRAHAVRKARRKLAWYRRKFMIEPERFTIGGMS